MKKVDILQHNKNDSRSVARFEENIKKAFTEMLVLFMLSERDYFIGELSEAIVSKSNQTILINRPYAVILRLLESNPPYVSEVKRRENPNARVRQYYSITKAGKDYLAELLESYQKYMKAIDLILVSGDKTNE